MQTPRIVLVVTYLHMSNLNCMIHILLYSTKIGIYQLAIFHLETPKKEFYLFKRDTFIGAFVVMKTQEGCIYTGIYLLSLLLVSIIHCMIISWFWTSYHFLHIITCTCQQMWIKYLTSRNRETNRWHLLIYICIDTSILLTMNQTIPESITKNKNINFVLYC